MMDADKKNKLFGQIAVKLGYITIDDVKNALLKQEADEITGQKKHLGTYFFEDELLTKEQISKILQLQKKYIEKFEQQEIETNNEAIPSSETPKPLAKKINSSEEKPQINSSIGQPTVDPLVKNTPPSTIAKTEVASSEFISNNETVTSESDASINTANTLNSSEISQPSSALSENQNGSEPLNSKSATTGNNSKLSPDAKEIATASLTLIKNKSSEIAKDMAPKLNKWFQYIVAQAQSLFKLTKNYYSSRKNNCLEAAVGNDVGDAIAEVTQPETTKISSSNNEYMHVSSTPSLCPECGVQILNTEMVCTECACPIEKQTKVSDEVTVGKNNSKFSISIKEKVTLKFVLISTALVLVCGYFFISPSTADLYKLGNEYYINPGIISDYTKSREYYEMAALRGHSGAQYKLGIMYTEGKGVHKDIMKAIGWLEKAALQGHAGAQFKLGKFLLYNAQGGFTGDAKAQFKAGKLYMAGKDVPENVKKAYKLFEKSAAQDYAAAQYWLGMTLIPDANFKDIDTSPKDMDKGYELLKKAALQCDENACDLITTYCNEYNQMFDDLVMAYIYENMNITCKKAVFKDFLKNNKKLSNLLKEMTSEQIEKAREIAKKIITKIEIVSKKSSGYDDYFFLPLYIGTFYKEGTFIEKDIKKAIKWYEKSVAQGDFYGYLHLIKIYRDGDVVPKDINKVIELYENASLHGISIYQSALGEIYYEGSIIPKDYKKALKWGEIAASQGDCKALKLMAVMYHMGHGVSKDNITAYAYCNIAASNYNDDDGTADKQKSIEITKKYRDKIQNEMTSEQIEKAQTKSREILKEIENNKKKEKNE